MAGASLFPGLSERELVRERVIARADQFRRDAGRDRWGPEVHGEPVMVRSRETIAVVSVKDSW